MIGLCTDIVTYDGGIPTGCPTSQIIAYYAYENMFNEIYRVYHIICTVSNNFYHIHPPSLSENML